MTLEKTSSTPNKISFDIPTFMDFLPPLKKLDLTPTEQKLYLQLSLEFQIVLDNTPSFQMGAYKWYQMLPERLQIYGLTNVEWERISNLGDNCDEIQDQLNELIVKMEKIT